MRKEAFQDIAKHFADSIDVKLVFEAGATPKTNGTTIILPTEMAHDYLDETLGALLHETNHIRYTNMKFFGNLKGVFRLVGNVLEDIRVDYLSLLKYPNSKCFYMSLVNDVIKNNLDKLLEEDLPNKKLKALIFEAYGVKLQTIYGSDPEFDEIAECVSFLQKEINKVYMANTTDELEDIIPIVVAKVFLPDNNQNKPKNSNNSNNSNNQGNQDSQAGDGSGSGKDNDTEANDDNDSNEDGKSNGENENADTSGKGQDNNGGGFSLFHTDEGDKDSEPSEFDKYVNGKRDISNLNDKIEEVHKEKTEVGEAYQKNLRSYKTYSTKLRKDKYNPSGKSDYYHKKIEERTAESAELQKKYNDLRKDISQLQADKYKITQDLKSMEDKLSSVPYADTTNDLKIMGFDALNKNKLLDENYKEVEYTPTLDSIIKEVLILKQEEYETEETGKLNNRYLQEIYTEVDNLFINKETKSIDTKVTILIDASGSMSAYEYGVSRHSICANAVNLIGKSFKKAVNEGAPGDMAIYAFSDAVVRLCDTITNFCGITESNFRGKGLGGGTDLAKAVNYIVDLCQQECNQRNIVIVITDAEVDDIELCRMDNLISTGDVRVIYVGIGVTMRTSKVKELFLNRNIKDLNSAPKILEEAMLQGFQWVN
jgi:hypothetical protein